MNSKEDLYKITRPIMNDRRNKYLLLASNYLLSNYRLITNTELKIKGKDIEVPLFVRNFIEECGEALLIANIVGGHILGYVCRSLDSHDFCNYGYGKGMFYGLGDLRSDFKYGDAIVLVEGTIDRDVCKLFITENCLGVLTSSLSVNQAIVLSNLTNRVILLLDNDEAGKIGETSIVKKLNKYNINIKVVPKEASIKDLGDLVPILYSAKASQGKYIINLYRETVRSYGGKLKEDLEYVYNTI